MKLISSLRPKNKLALAIFFASLYGIFAASLGAVVKLASSQGVSFTSIVLWRNLVGAFALLLWILVLSPHRKKISYLKTPQLKMQALRSITGLIAVVLYFYSLKTLPLSDSTLLLFTSPIFVPIIAFFWHRLALRHEMWWGLIISFIGIGVVLNPGKEIFHPASILALLSGVFAAIAILSLRLSHYSEPGERTLFYNFGIATLIMLIVGVFTLEEDLPDYNTLWLLAIGVIALIAQIFLTSAAKYAPMRLLSPFFYVAVIFSIFLDLWIWGHPITPQIIWGCALIILGNALMVILYPKDDLKKR